MIKNLPIQPIYLDNGVARFQANKIVEMLLQQGNIDMNMISRWDVPTEDREQFAQLIGYSLSGFSELSYVRNETYNAAREMFDSGECEKDAQIKSLQAELNAIKDGIREAVARLFAVHPDDLDEDKR